MGRKIFSKSPLTWGQIVFLWVGGLLVAGPLAVGAAAVLIPAENKWNEANQLAERAQRYERLGVAAFGGFDRLRAEFDQYYPGFSMALDSVGIDSVRVDSVVRTDFATTIRERAAGPRRAAVTYFVVSIALGLGSLAVLSFLIWRGFHAAARRQWV